MISITKMHGPMNTKKSIFFSFWYFSKSSSFLMTENDPFVFVC